MVGMVEVRMFLNSDHPTVAQWWKQHEWPVIPFERLSPFGMMSCVDGMPAAAAWLYPGPSKMWLLEWVVSNPAVPLKARHEAVKCLLERLKLEVKAMGGGMVMNFTKSKGLVKLFKRVGFAVHDTGMTALGISV